MRSNPYQSPQTEGAIVPTPWAVFARVSLLFQFLTFLASMVVDTLSEEYGIVIHPSLGFALSMISILFAGFVGVCLIKE